LCAFVTLNKRLLTYLLTYNAPITKFQQNPTICGRPIDAMTQPISPTH